MLLSGGLGFNKWVVGTATIGADMEKSYSSCGSLRLHNQIQLNPYYTHVHMWMVALPCAEPRKSGFITFLKMLSTASIKLGFLLFAYLYLLSFIQVCTR